MKVLTSGLLILAVLTASCAVIDDPASNKPTQRFDPIETPINSPTVNHGQVTVRSVHERSDIAVLPPTVQHVVWFRDGSPEVGVVPVIEPANAPPTKQAKTTSGETRRVKDRWPLLERDMDFDSEIRQLDMCNPKTTCGPEDRCVDIEPCENPELYECFTTKQGNYCLEVNE